MNRRTVCYFSVSDHQVYLVREECCSKRRVCHLNDQMEQLGLTLDRPKFHAWRPIYVSDCWTQGVALNETTNFFTYSLSCAIVVDITDKSKQVQK